MAFDSTRTELKRCSDRLRGPSRYVHFRLDCTASHPQFGSHSCAQAIKTAVFDAENAKYELEVPQAAIKQFSQSEEEVSAAPFELFAPIAGKVLRVFEESSTVVF